MTAQNLALYCFLALSIVLILYAAVILWKIFRGDINLDGLLSESPGQGQPADATKASLSRFQFLIFSFVTAGLYLLLSIQAGTFVDIPVNVLGLLGISGGSYLISKAVS
jgi:hypothetical protein